ncbi:MAG: Rne/Rng family ribonuclease [Pyrinomonadaceae bacterium]|nr:Rne/Rng family ribonuclease [Pyrinomonadaceae bacterium]
MGEILKDARIQERITDQVRAIEFEMDAPKTFEIGSLDLVTETSSFQRIEDDEVSPATTTATNVKPAENAEIESLEPESKGRRRSSNRRNKKIEENAAPKIETSPEASETSETGEDNSDDKRKRGKSPRNKKVMTTENAPESKENEVESTELSENSSDSDSSANANNSLENANVDSDTQTEVDIQNELSESSPSDAMVSETYENAQASVDDFGVSRDEFAVRRGGRRRRRPQSETEATDENAGNSEETTGESPENVEVVEPEPQAVAQNSRPTNNRDGRDNRDSRDSRSSQPRDAKNSRRPPTITDLLREGQEILVQIAKEPIAKKGARITSHIALPGRYLVYMPTIEHVGVSRKIESSSERTRLRALIQRIRNEEDVPSGGFIVRTAGIGITEQNLRDDARYLVRTWLDIRKQAEKSKSPALVHQDLDLVQRILRDQLSDDFAAIRVDTEEEYLNIVEFINRIQPKMVNRVKLHTREESILQTYGIQDEIDKAIKPRVWLKSGGYLVINQTEALVAIDVNTGKFVGKGANRLEDTITKTNMEAVDEIARQIRLRDLGGIIVLDLIDMEDRRNRQKVLQALQDALQDDKSPTKVLTFNDFGLVIMTRKRVKQSLERTLCSPCPYCTGAGLVKSPQTICYEILAEARTLAKQMKDGISQTTLRVNKEVAKVLRTTERDVLIEIEDYLGTVDVTSDASVHQEQFDFAFI